MDSDRTEKVLKSLEKKAWNSYLPILGFEKGRILTDFIHRTQPKRILEVGTLVGYSAILMAKELEANSEIISVEIHETEAEIAKENIRKAGVKPSIHVLVGDALEIIPQLQGPFDMVFLDADKNEYFEYLKNVEGKLHSGSIIVADNTNMSTPSMRKYLTYVRNSGNYQSPVNTTYQDEMEVSLKL
ncbi:MAG: O-methyltransferase [Candidatus Bathyarchaeota archaeon]